jgi:tRNA A37 methylthiotransferase MiaB
MPKKIISFVSPNFQQGPKELNAYYLPYSPGILWSYVNQFPSINESYELGEFIWRREDIDDAVEILKDSDVIGFSTYIWNRSYTKELGKALKLANPNLFIIGGGPEFPIEKEDIFEQYPFLDICVKLEGEKTFRAVLEEHLKDTPDYKSIKGMLVNDNGVAFSTGDTVRIDDLDTIPSPYLTGVFDKLIAKHPEIRWNGTIETNRGCPYACTFCDWGSLTYNKVKVFELERVFSELEWMGQNQFDFISFTDANFGIFAERDSLIADKLIAVQKEYGMPRAYTIAWAKNQKKEVVDIVKKLIYEGGAKIGLNLSVQTMDENTLEIIKRTNLDTNKIEEVFEMCEEANIPLYTELILGLPGETLTSWKENFYRLYKAGNHTGITVYQAQLLENAEMNLTQRKMYKLKGQVVYDYLVGSNNEKNLREGVEIVVSTRDLTPEKMLEAQLHSWYQNTFHINGMTNYISRVLYKLHGVEYRDFYEKLYKYIEKDPWLNSEIQRIGKHYGLWGEKGMIDHPLLQGMQIHGWNLIHSTIIMLQSENKHKHIFDIIEQFMLNEYPLPKDLHDELMTIQRNYLIDYTQCGTYPKIIDFKYDIFGYLQNQNELEVPARYEFDFPEDKGMTLEKFCEQIFFARRRNFGKAWVTRVK